MTEDTAVTEELPDGEYAVIEVLGHRTYVGRVEEVERFGTKLMSIEPLFRGKFLPPVLISGTSIYQFTPCDKATAAQRSPKHEYQLPAPIRLAIPAEGLPAPELGPFEAFDGDIEID